MKNTQLLLLSFALSIFFFACSEKKSSPISPNAKKTSEVDLSEVREAVNYTLIDTIGEQKFNKWKRNWDTNFRNYMKNDSIRYFELPIIDMQQLINSGAKDTRFYIGLEPVLNDPQRNFYPHIMAVGMNNKNIENRNLILDYSTTCPPNCPPPKQ